MRIIKEKRKNKNHFKLDKLKKKMKKRISKVGKIIINNHKLEKILKLY